MPNDKYISGEEHKAMSVSSASTPKKVTIAMPSIATIVVVIILCALSFGLGVISQKHGTKTVVATSSVTGGHFTGGGGFGGHRSGGFGQVTAVSPTSITITNERSGASSTYAITASTTITDSGQTVTTSSIQTGDTVIIMTSSSSTSTATSILVNPSFGGGFGGGASGSSSSGSSTSGSSTSQ
jgi:hypothetical protein